MTDTLLTLALLTGDDPHLRLVAAIRPAEAAAILASCPGSVLIDMELPASVTDVLRSQLASPLRHVLATVGSVNVDSGMWVSGPMAGQIAPDPSEPARLTAAPKENSTVTDVKPFYVQSVTIPAELLQYVDTELFRSLPEERALADAYNAALDQAWPDGPPGGWSGYVDLNEPVPASHLLGMTIRSDAASKSEAWEQALTAIGLGIERLDDLTIRITSMPWPQGIGIDGRRLAGQDGPA